MGTTLRPTSFAAAVTSNGPDLRQKILITILVENDLSFLLCFTGPHGASGKESIDVAISTLKQPNIEGVPSVGLNRVFTGRERLLSHDEVEWDVCNLAALRLGGNGYG